MNLQNSKYQYIKSGGPTVEGKYRLNLKPDPERVANVDLKTGGLLRSPEGGIEKIPLKVDVPGKEGYVWTYEDWGKNRVRLEPISVIKPKDEYGREYDRDLNSYYFHDSEKGYSHGCDEIETEFFNVLKQYREEGNDNIQVQVKYPTKNHNTNGGTEKNKTTKTE